MYRLIDEDVRLQALDLYKILDSLPEKPFDDIAELASQICDTPIALLSFIDKRRQWVKAKVGLTTSQVAREFTFCDSTIQQDSIFIIEDTTQDLRFRDNPFVVDDPHIRFYAGVPLLTNGKIPIGTLCVSDKKPRKLSARQIEGLESLARQVMVILECRNIQTHYNDSQTDVKDARMEASLASRNLEALLSSSPFAVAVLEGPEHVFTRANEAYFNLVGNRKLLGQSVREAFPDLSSQPFYALLDQVYKSGETFHAKEILVEFADRQGRTYSTFVDLSYIPHLSIRGEVDGIGVFAVDVTEKVMARQQIEEKEQFLTLITNNMPAHIVYVDRDYKLQFTNANTQKFFGRSAESMKGLPIAEILTEEHLEQRMPSYRKVLLGERQTLKVQSFDSEGLLHTTMNVAVPDIGDDGQVKGFFAIAYDQTAEENLKREIEQARELAETANNAKSAFLANMSHEIRSPLGAIMGFANLIREVVPVEEETESYFQIIERNSQQVLRIIDDILDLSKVEAGKMMIENINFSLLEVLADFASLMGFKARENGIEFVMQAETALPDPANSDPTRLRQILTNVVGNALKFTKKGRVTLSVSYDEPYLQFNVQDTGIGISGAEADRLFQAFNQADVSMTRKFGGTGLGLVLTKRLAQAMGGDFWLESSEIEKGSLFIAKVKIDTCFDTKLVSANQFKYGNVKSLAGKLSEKILVGRKILLVEDSPDNQMLIKVILKKVGATVDIASDGFEGYERATASDYDLVLMDVQMPRMDGYETVGKLRAEGYQKPVIAITAHAMKDEREKCILAGYSDYVAKPIDKMVLVETVHHHLRERN